MLNAIVLGLCCVLSLAWPAGGVLLLLVLESSIFYLGSLATVPLPMGYARPSDVMVLCILAGALLRAGGYDILPRALHRSQAAAAIDLRRQALAHEQDRRIRKALVLAIVPYLAWFGLCAIQSVVVPNDEAWTVNVRGIAVYIIPWALVPTVWLCRDQASLIRGGVLAIASVTAIIHLGIQLLDYRSLMAAAYWSYIGGTNDYIESVIAHDEFGRGLPAGTMLMLLVGIYAFGRYLLEESHRRRPVMLGIAMLQFAGIGITFTRSLTLEVVAGCVLACLLALWATNDRARLKKNILGASLLFALMVAVIVLERPGVMDFWKQRIVDLEDDRQIFSTDTMRGQDNLSAWSALVDRPVLGSGSSRTAARYALREGRDQNKDIHPLLSIGLVGGFPCILLVLLMQVGLVRGLWMQAKDNLLLRSAAAPCLAIVLTALLAINVIGAGGTYSGLGLMAFALMVGLGAAELSRATIQARRDDGTSQRRLALTARPLP
jgi:hypothetical protein